MPSVPQMLEAHASALLAGDPEIGECLLIACPTTGRPMLCHRVRPPRHMAPARWRRLLNLLHSVSAAELAKLDAAEQPQ